VIVYPAIDLRQGKVVRLQQGQPDAQTVFSDDPVKIAAHWITQGSEWLHVINLDGALTGADYTGLSETPNQKALRRILEAVEIPVQFGGGLRDFEAIEAVFELGVARVVLGTVALTNPDVLDLTLNKYGPESVAVSIDARDGRVATHGWQQLSDMDVIEMGQRMRARGVSRVVYTDISRDGMLTGVNVEATVHLAEQTGLQVIASGGVASLRDIVALKAQESAGIEGVIVGQALYTGAIVLRHAVVLARGVKPACLHEINQGYTV